MQATASNTIATFLESYMFYSVAAAMDQKADIDDMNKVFLACFPTAETQHRPVIQAIQKMI